MTRTVAGSQLGFSKNANRKKLAKQILLLDQASLLRKTLQGLLENEALFQDYQMSVAHNSEFFIQAVSSGKVNILIVVDREAEKWIPLLEFARQVSPQTVRIVIAEKWQQAALIAFINSGQIFRALDLSIDDFELKTHLISADLESESYQTRANLKAVFAEQNRKLESLNLDLERMVEEKTADIRKSKEQIDEKVLRMRQLTTFIKDLSAQITFHEFMTLLRRDIRKFAKTGDPILIIQSQESLHEIISFSAGNVLKQSSNRFLTISTQMQTNDKLTAQFLADFFHRPMIQIISIPLQLSAIMERNHHQPRAVLCIEHSMNQIELENFLEHLTERLQPMSMAVDRAFLQKEMSHQYYRWEKTFDGLKDPIAIIDAEYGIIRTNKKFSDKVMHRACYEEFAGRTSVCPECPLAEAIRTGCAQNKQIQIQGRIFEVTSYPIAQSQQAKGTSVVNLYKDVTSSRELYARLLQNEKMSAIGLLAGNIAHELNNPLTGIRSLAQVLMTETADRSQLQNDLQEIEKASKRSQQIIRNLLEFSSGTTNTSKFISVDEIFEKTLPMLKAVMRNLRTDIQLNSHGAVVLAEPQLVQQVIFNLIQNASQAMENQKKPCILKISSCLQTDGFVELSVEDNGPGIPPELQIKIFEPFFTTKPEGQGTGLGLSLSQDILRRFGGDLVLHSKINEGAKFTIRLPSSNPGVGEII